MFTISLERTGYILSVKMSSSELMRVFSEFSTMTDDPSDSNPTCSEYSTHEESLYHILSFEIVQKKGSIFGVAFGRLLPFLPTELTLIWMIPPGDEFLSCKVSCWPPYPIWVYFEYHGAPL